MLCAMYGVSRACSFGPTANRWYCDGDELRAEAGDHIEHDRGDERRQRAARRQERGDDAEQADAEQHARGRNPNRDIRVGRAEDQRPARDELARRRRARLRTPAREMPRRRGARDDGGRPGAIIRPSRGRHADAAAEHVDADAADRGQRHQKQQPRAERARDRQREDVEADVVPEHRVGLSEGARPSATSGSAARGSTPEMPAASAAMAATSATSRGSCVRPGSVTGTAGCPTHSTGVRRAFRRAHGAD